MVDVLSKIRKKPAFGVAPVLSLLLVILLTVVFIRMGNSPYMVSNITDISGQWQYYTDHDPAPQPIRLPHGTKGVYLNENWYITHTLAEQGYNAAIMFRSDYLRVIAELDGEVIYRHGYGEMPFASPGKKLNLIPLPGDYAGKEITLTLTPTMNLRAYSIYMGDQASLISYATGKSLPVFGMGILVFVLGATLLGVYFIHRKNGQAMTADFWFGVFVILVGLHLPGKSLLFLILLNPLQATFVPMISIYILQQVQGSCHHCPLRTYGRLFAHCSDANFHAQSPHRDSGSLYIPYSGLLRVGCVGLCHGNTCRRRKISKIEMGRSFTHRHGNCGETKRRTGESAACQRCGDVLQNGIVFVYHHRSSGQD